jgi:hypothetical protein
VLGAGLPDRPPRHLRAGGSGAWTRWTVVSPSTGLHWVPSIIWVSDGLLRPAKVTVPLAPVYQRAGIEFVQAAPTPVSRTASATPAPWTRRGHGLAAWRPATGTGRRPQRPLPERLDLLIQRLARRRHPLLAPPLDPRLLHQPIHLRSNRRSHTPPARPGRSPAQTAARIQKAQEIRRAVPLLWDQQIDLADPGSPSPVAVTVAGRQTPPRRHVPELRNRSQPPPSTRRATSATASRTRSSSRPSRTCATTSATVMLRLSTIVVSPTRPTLC